MDLLEIKEDIKRFSPKPIRKFARESLKHYREFRNNVFSSIFRSQISENYLLKKFSALGIKNGDVLLVHSSLSRLGHVDGGAETILSALLKSVGTNGTIGAPTFWGNAELYIRGPKIFDARNSPSILGKITELIRMHPDAIRSLHPTHSATFIGPLAKSLVSEHHYDNTPVGPHSPYFKLTKVKGKILLLGVTLEYLTNFHTIEDVINDFPIKVYVDDPILFKVIDLHGKEFEVTTYIHCPQAAILRQCNKMKPYFEKYGVLKETKLGNSKSLLLDAKALHETLLDLYKAGITMYSPG